MPVRACSFGRGEPKIIDDQSLWRTEQLEWQQEVKVPGLVGFLSIEGGCSATYEDSGYVSAPERRAHPERNVGEVQALESFHKGFPIRRGLRLRSTILDRRAVSRMANCWSRSASWV